LRNAMDKDSGVKFVNLKLEQMYGPADNENKFIPIMIKRLKSGEKIGLTEGEQKRDFVYVKDVANAFLLVLEHFDELAKFEEFEIGRGKSCSIKEVMKILKAELKSESILDWGAMPYRKNELMDSYAKIDNNKKIGWYAEVALDDGLQKTIEYYNN